jgi:hypothetical protein
MTLLKYCTCSLILLLDITLPVLNGYICCPPSKTAIRKLFQLQKCHLNQRMPPYHQCKSMYYLHITRALHFRTEHSLIHHIHMPARSCSLSEKHLERSLLKIWQDVSRFLITMKPSCNYKHNKCVKCDTVNATQTGSTTSKLTTLHMSTKFY